MVPTRVLSVVVLAAVSLAGSIAGLPTARAGVVQARYAAPTGSAASSCAPTTPCDLATAINGASAGVDVVVAPGIYYSSADPLTIPLTNPNPVTIHAEIAAQIPVIYTAASTGLLLTNSDISDLVLVASGPTAGIQLTGGSADHVAVFASAGDVGACALYGVTLTDSVCSQTGTNDPAIGVSANAPGTSGNVLRNVTAVASGVGSYAFNATASNVAFSNAVSNTILNGESGDIRLSVAGPGSMTMTIDHSSYRPSATDLTGGGQLITGAANVSAVAELVNPAADNFEELSSSPTIDAGAKAPTADVDLANLPRTIGKATDIGAYELAVAPAVHQFRVLSVKRHAARVTVKVNSQGLPTVAAITATTHGRAITSSAHPVTTAAATTFTVHHLNRHRKYAIQVTASSSGGTTLSRLRSFTTK